ncbi:MAG: NAD(P)/FAD-dependent oxidoreductase [Gammaproteobacteria bacterium]|nr:NAD(P)/FAD-dependent oxidoreductase [Gammaproteobacteria bacterium]
MESNLELNKKNLVIIGGGFAGTKLASTIEKALSTEWEIYLLSNTNFVTYNPLLAEVVGASVLPNHVQAPIRQIVKRTRVRMVTVDSIDYEKHIVHYHNDEPGQLRFDQLVFACGVAANMTMLEGLDQFSLPLKTVGDALCIRNQIVDRLEQATIHPDPKRRKALTSFVVIGGGFSGVEVAGEIQSFLKASVRYYKNVEMKNCNITILHGKNCLLSEMPESLGKATEKIFLKRGINIRLNVRAQKIEPEKVILTNGEIIPAATIICTIGTSPHAFVQSDQLPLERGKITAQADMSVKGLEGVWALGDCALVPNAHNNRLSPPTAQFANRQAIVLSANIIAKLTGRKTLPFAYKPIGMLASIGQHRAVADLYGIRISGLIAFLIWRGIYLLKVPTLARKVRLFLEWNWTLLFPADIAHLGFKRTLDK